MFKINSNEQRRLVEIALENMSEEELKAFTNLSGEMYQKGMLTGWLLTMGGVLIGHACYSIFLQYLEKRAYKKGQLEFWKQKAKELERVQKES